METDELIYAKVRTLPPEKQQKVLDFVESLENENAKKAPLHSVEGLWADLDFDLTDEDIAEARREMWGVFAREGI